MHERWRNAVGQLDRYGPHSEKAVDVVESLAEFFDDCVHGRDVLVIRESFEKAITALGDLGEREIQRAGAWP